MTNSKESKAISPKNLMLQDLARSGLTIKDSHQLKCIPLTSQRTTTLTGFLKNDDYDNLLNNCTAYQIPYFNVENRKINYYRIKFISLNQETPRKELLRYWQPSGTVPRLYLPPFLRWNSLLKDEETPLYITEGEKKAARACKDGIPCIGLGGVWNWRAAKKEIGLNFIQKRI